MARPFLGTFSGDLILEHTLGHINCPACETLRRQIISPSSFGQLLFPAAAAAWLDERRKTLSSKSIEGYEYYIRSLTRFFSALRLAEIHIGHIQAYQRWRQQPDVDHKLRGAGPSCINHEVNTLSQILDRAGLWIEIAKFYKPMRLPKAKIGKAMSDQEEEQLFRAAAQSGHWKVAYWASLLTAHTSAGAGEIRHLRLSEIDLSARVINVSEGTKNDYRIRSIPLNPTAFWAAQQIVNRYRKACRRARIEPNADHYPLYHNGPDFTRPITSWKKAWWALRRAAGLEQIRMYDLRHHALTRLLENPDISEQTIKDIAGQVSKKMIDRYSHIRLKAKRDAVEALERKAPKSDPGANVITFRAKKP